MNATSDMANAPKEFLRLFTMGKQAAKRGDAAEAHELFRRAIEIDPYYEQVWLWLASVVETDDDRRVCFENVLEISPAHPTARHQLAKLDQDTLERSPAHQVGPQAAGPSWRVLRLVLLVLIAFAALAALVATGVI